MAAPMRIGGRALADLLPDVRAMPGPVYDALARTISMLVVVAATTVGDPVAGWLWTTKSAV